MPAVLLQLMIDIVYSIFFSNKNYFIIFAISYFLINVAIKFQNYGTFFIKKPLICKGCDSEFEVSKRAKFILNCYEWIFILLWILVVTLVQIFIDEKQIFSLTSVIIGTFVFVMAQSIILLLIPYKITKVGKKKA